MTDVFGEPVEDLVAMSLGGGAGLATSAIVYPKLSGIAGGLTGNKFIGALAQGATTALAGVVEGDVIVKRVASQRHTDKFKAGAVLVGFVQALGNMFGGLPYGVTAPSTAALSNPLAGVLGLTSGAAAPKAASSTTATTNYAPTRVQGI